MDEQYNKCHLSWPKNHVGWNCEVVSSWEVAMEMEIGIWIFFFLRGSLEILVCGIKLSDKSVPRHLTCVVWSYMETEANQSSEESIYKPDFCQNL